MYGDPQHLDEIALSLDARAEQLDTAAAEFIGRTQAVRWHSTAAGAMRSHVQETAEQFRGSAKAYRDAAESVRELARSLRRMLAWIAEIEQTVRGLVAAAKDRIVALGHTVADAVDGLGDAVGDGVAEVGSWLGIGDGPDPDPADVSLCQTAWPPSGHKDWLDHAGLAGAA